MATRLDATGPTVQALTQLRQTTFLAGEPVTWNMRDPAQQKRAYLLLAAVFGVAGVVWFIYGLMSPRWVFYPLIGLANLGIAYVCKRCSD